MAYSGKYKVKNRSKYSGDPDTVIYRSSWEKAVFNWCDNEPTVKSWSSEEVVVPYYWDIDKKYHRYFVDLKVTFTNGKRNAFQSSKSEGTDSNCIITNRSPGSCVPHAGFVLTGHF